MELLPGNWKNNNIDINSIPLNIVAHLGDAVYELYIRRKLIFSTKSISVLHETTTNLVNSQFHANLLDYLKPYLTEDELNIIRRARNTNITVSKKKDQAIHRLSTSLEALIGYLYITDLQRLDELFSLTDNYLDKIN